MARKKSGRTSGVRKSGKGTGKFKRSTGKSKAISGRKGRRSTGRVRAVPRPTGHELVPVVCSECFEEFAFDTGVRTESLVCPVCEHSAARPDDATLHRISGLRRAEKTNFMIAFILTVVGMVSFSAWVVLMRNPANSYDNGMFWGPVAVSLLCALILMVFVFKYEGNRWETYF